MARLGRGQPFRPLIRPATLAGNAVIVNGLTATVSVQAPTGTAGSKLTGSLATVAVAAPVGTVTAGVTIYGSRPP